MSLSEPYENQETPILEPGKFIETRPDNMVIPLTTAPISLDEFILSYRSFLLYLKSKGFGIGDEQEKFLDKVADWAKIRQQNDD